MDVDAVTAEVATAVGLAEGPAGVADVLRVIARHEPVAAREISRRAELPVPIVAAVCNELRKRGVVDRSRPVRLTPEGRASLTGQAEPDTWQAEITGRCPGCDGLGVVVPDAVADLAGRLEAAELGEPAAKLDLDQTHCTAATKLRRVLAMHEAGALAGQRILLLGDDDLVSVALAVFAGHAGAAARPRGVTVLDCDPDLVSYLRGELRDPGFPAEVIEHDLRDPLPAALTGAFDVACTDPPYTVPGAELFLSRAVDALAPGAGGHVFFSFGPRRPAETVATQRLMTDMGLAIRSLTPGFNFYTGAGILAGTSHLYHLRTTQDSKPARTGRYDGPLYSAQTRAAVTRPYRCVACGAVHEVGPGARWTRIAELKAAGCPACGGTVLRPRPLGAGQGQGPRDGVAGAAGQRGGSGGSTPRASTWGVPGRLAARTSRSGPVMTEGTAEFLIRPARDSDLDVIAGFEIDIARASFGDEAIEDAALHRKRVAAALGKPGEVTLVAVVAGSNGPPVGWAWLSGRTNSLTGARYGSFRSLATADVPGRGTVAELLMAAVMQAAAQAGYTHLTGKTHARNLGMRALYRKFGFEATHLTMEWRPAAATGEPGGEADR